MCYWVGEGWWWGSNGNIDLSTLAGESVTAACRWLLSVTVRRPLLPMELGSPNSL